MVIFQTLDLSRLRKRRTLNDGSQNLTASKLKKKGIKQGQYLKSITNQGGWQVQACSPAKWPNIFVHWQARMQRCWLVVDPRSPQGPWPIPSPSSKLQAWPTKLPLLLSSRLNTIIKNCGKACTLSAPGQTNSFGHTFLLKQAEHSSISSFPCKITNHISF